MNRSSTRRRALGLVALLLAAGVAQGATAWVADASSSRLDFTGTLAGGTFDGRFHRFQPGIAFDPADLAGSRFEVTIEMGTADTLDADRDAILKGPEFFAVERWPTARFEARRFTETGPGRYAAQGRLTLRDVTREVALEFTFKPSVDGRRAELAGDTSIRRLDFGVGQGEWRDTQWVGDAVQVRFALVLQRK